MDRPMNYTAEIRGSEYGVCISIRGVDGRLLEISGHIPCPLDTLDNIMALVAYAIKKDMADK